MSYVTQSLARQSAIANQNRAEMAAIKASAAQQSLLNSRSRDLSALAKKDLRLQLNKERAELQARAARAQRDTLKKKKLDCYA